MSDKDGGPALTPEEELRRLMEPEEPWTVTEARKRAAASLGIVVRPMLIGNPSSMLKARKESQ